MKKVKIITDSCSDLDKNLLEQYDIDYAKMNTVYQGKETPASLLWEYYSQKEFYDIMRGGERITTTQVPPEEFNLIFKKYLDEGYDIVYIGCSTKQSGSVNTASVIAKNILSEYPDSKIYCVDSLNASVGEGILAIYAAKLAAEGKDADEIHEAVLEKRNFVLEFLTVHSLEWLRRAGRVTGAKAFFGNLMGVKPIIIADAEGVQTPITKIKGRGKSIEEVASLLANSITDAEDQTVYLIHTNCADEEIEALKKHICDKISCKDIYPLCIGPIIGASVGPDAIGVIAFGKEVTYKVSEAK